jgi:hypothetical protein
MPGFGKVGRRKLIQLQRVAGSEDQVIEIADLLKEILNVSLIREIKRVPFRFSVERCYRLLNPVRIARRPALTLQFGETLPRRLDLRCCPPE